MNRSRFVLLPIALALSACGDGNFITGYNESSSYPQVAGEYNIFYKEGKISCSGVSGFKEGAWPGKTAKIKITQQNDSLTIGSVNKEPEPEGTTSKTIEDTHHITTTGEYHGHEIGEITDGKNTLRGEVTTTGQFAGINFTGSATVFTTETTSKGVDKCRIDQKFTGERIPPKA